MSQDSDCLGYERDIEYHRDFHTRQCFDIWLDFGKQTLDFCRKTAEKRLMFLAAGKGPYASFYECQLVEDYVARAHYDTVVKFQRFVDEIVCDDIIGSVKLLHERFYNFFRGHIDMFLCYVETCHRLCFCFVSNGDIRHH